LFADDIDASGGVVEIGAAVAGLDLEQSAFNGRGAAEAP
jgi:hypothetical protein